MKNSTIFAAVLLLSAVNCSVIRSLRPTSDIDSFTDRIANITKSTRVSIQRVPGYFSNGIPIVRPAPSDGNELIPFGQHGFYPDYIQKPQGPNVMALYPNFDYIVSNRPWLGNLLFSPSPFILRPEGATWTGLRNGHIPRVWKPVADYPFGNDGDQPYRELKNYIKSWSKLGLPVNWLDKMLDEVQKNRARRLPGRQVSPDKIEEVNEV